MTIRTEVEELLVIGGGIMGSGIAQVAAGSGLRVTLVDVSDDVLERALASIERGLERRARGDEAAADAARSALDRISVTTDLDAAARRADHVIEAVSEDLELKLGIFELLDDLCEPDVVLATNTSQFAISRLAAATDRPDRVIGTHWFNPPAVMRLIEIIRGIETSDETLELALELAGRFGKETIVCKRDTQGFVTSRLISLLMIEAMRIVEEGIADIDDVNRACVLAFNHAMGPLDTADLSGLDTTERVADAMTTHYGERFRPPQILRALVSAGHLGRKAGRGFRDYAEPA